MTDNNDELESVLLTGDELERAIENAEWGDEYDDVPRYSELSRDEQAEYETLGEDFALAASLGTGSVPPVGTSIEKLCEGETKAEALGRAYTTRDQIRDAGGSCEVEYIEPTIIIPPHLYHTVEITITETPEEGE